MNKTQFKLIGAAIAVVLVSTAIFYAINTQKSVSDEKGYPEYAVLNFGSYEDFNTFLQTSSNSSSPSRDSLVTDDLSVPNSNDVTEGGLDEKVSALGADVDYSETNIQELGVDEPDIVKTDGTYLYVISNSKLYIIYAYPTEDAKIVSTITFNESHYAQNLFVNKDRIAVITQSYIYRDYPLKVEDDTTSTASSEMYTNWMDTTSTHILIYDISDKVNPINIHDIQMDGYYSNARMIDDYVYVITTQYSYEPILYADEDSNYMPKISVDGVVENIGLSDIYYVDSPTASKTLTHIISVNIQDAAEDVTAEVFLLGDPSTIYVSSENIYITSISYDYDYTIMNDLIRTYVLPYLPDEATDELEKLDTLSLDDYQKVTVSEWIIQNYAENMDEEDKQTIAKQIVTQYEKTIVHKISIDQGDITYHSQGTVPGYINNQFSISEYNGYLRVATTVHGWMMKPYLSSIDSYNNVYVLDESLNIIGELEDIAVGEQIYSVRFMDTICYLVTFEQVDPFFVIDLQDPMHPTILGQLKIPGYSTYLHPYDDTHVIGIGQDGGNVKISLFDVEDVANPQELTTYQIQQTSAEYSWSYSSALYEHKAFLFDLEKQLLIMPVSVNYKESAYVFNISEEGITLKGIITHESDSNETEGQDPWKSSYWMGDYSYSVKRSLYIQDVIYTISDAMIKMNDMMMLNELASIILS